MIIKTRGKEYYVINETSEFPEVFICREKDSTGSLSYTILKLPTSEITADMVKYLMSQVKNDSFTEFVDYTTDNGYLYVVMSNPAGLEFKEYVDNGELGFTERLILGRRCLEHLFLSDFPEYFIHSALHKGVFKITESLDTYFEFDLSDFRDYQSIGLREAAAAIAAVMGNLFRPELNRVAFAPMAEFIDKLNSGAYRTLMEIYRDYDEIFKEWQGKESYELPSHTKWEKFKAWCKKALGVLKSSIIYLILIAALIYLIDAIVVLSQPYEQKKVYDKIGDVFIIDSEEEVTDGN